jgi:hypothetical protein
MLDEHPSPRAVRLGVGQQFADHIELMEARKELIALFLVVFRVFAFDDLGVVLNDIRQAQRRENVFPEIARL